MSKLALAFLSRHIPTAKQVELAKAQGFTLHHIGDTDAFTVVPSFVNEAGTRLGIRITPPPPAP